MTEKKNIINLYWNAITSRFNGKRIIIKPNKENDGIIINFFKVVSKDETHLSTTKVQVNHGRVITTIALSDEAANKLCEALVFYYKSGKEHINNNTNVLPKV